MQPFQPFFNPNVNFDRFFSSPTPTSQYVQSPQPFVLGEGDVASVVNPNGSFTFFFVPAMKPWLPISFHPNMPSYIHPYWYTDSGVWVIRSISNPIPWNLFLQILQRYNSNITEYNSNNLVYPATQTLQLPEPQIMEHMPILPFHSDCVTSTTDLQYFFPRPDISVNTLRMHCECTRMKELERSSEFSASNRLNEMEVNQPFDESQNMNEMQMSQQFAVPQFCAPQPVVCSRPCYCAPLSHSSKQCTTKDFSFRPPYQNGKAEYASQTRDRENNGGKKCLCVDGDGKPYMPCLCSSGHSIHKSERSESSRKSHKGSSSESLSDDCKSRTSSKHTSTRKSKKCCQGSDGAPSDKRKKSFNQCKCSEIFATDERCGDQKHRNSSKNSKSVYHDDKPHQRDIEYPTYSSSSMFEDDSKKKKEERKSKESVCTDDTCPGRNKKKSCNAETCFALNKKEPPCVNKTCPVKSKEPLKLESSCNNQSCPANESNSSCTCGLTKTSEETTSYCGVEVCPGEKVTSKESISSWNLEAAPNRDFKNKESSCSLNSCPAKKESACPPKKENLCPPKKENPCPPKIEKPCPWPEPKKVASCDINTCPARKKECNKKTCPARKKRPSSPTESDDSQKKEKEYRSDNLERTNSNSSKSERENRKSSSSVMFVNKSKITNSCSDCTHCSMSQSEKKPFSWRSFIDPTKFMSRSKKSLDSRCCSKCSNENMSGTTNKLYGVSSDKDTETIEVDEKTSDDLIRTAGKKFKPDICCNMETRFLVGKRRKQDSNNCTCSSTSLDQDNFAFGCCGVRENATDPLKATLDKHITTYNDNSTNCAKVTATQTKKCKCRPRCYKKENSVKRHKKDYEADLWEPKLTSEFDCHQLLLDLRGSVPCLYSKNIQ